MRFTQKGQTMQSQDENLKERVSDWLEKQGYPLEMEVALAFQKEGFTVSLSDWYKDFNSGESREIRCKGIAVVRLQ